MFSAENILALISLIIAAAACVATWMSVNNSIKEEQQRAAAQHAEIITKLSFVADDLKELKMDLRSVKDEVNEVRKSAENAGIVAFDCRRRLDRIEGIQ